MPPIKPFYLDLSEAEIEQVAAATAEVLRSGMLILGPRTAAFEEAFAAYVGTRHAVATSSGTSALEIMLRVREVAGRTVLVPTNTNFATAAAVLHAGGKVRFLDMDEKSFAPSLAQVEDALDRFADEDVAGILWVHLGGVVSAEFPAVVELCRSRGLFVLEDAAHAHGSSLGGVRSGALADAAAFSFLFTPRPLTLSTAGLALGNSLVDLFESLAVVLGVVSGVVVSEIRGDVARVVLAEHGVVVAAQCVVASGILPG